MPIPRFNQRGELPVGEHVATLEDIESRFGSANERRRDLMEGLSRAVDQLFSANVSKIWIDGSFVSHKSLPNDIDAVWDHHGVDWKSLPPIFLASRAEMKWEFGAEFFMNVIETGSGEPFPKFFQQNRDGEEKGIIVLRNENIR